MSVIDMFTKKKEQPTQEEFTALIGEVSLNVPEFEYEIDIEVRGLRAPNAVRYWIVAELPGEVPVGFRLGFHNEHKVFGPNVSSAELRGWVLDTIHKLFPRAEVTLV